MKDIFITCVKCKQQLEPFELQKRPGGIDYNFVFVCTNLECPNCGLLCMSKEMLEKFWSLVHQGMIPRVAMRNLQSI